MGMIVDYKNDIYFDPRLGNIYARLEGGIFQEYRYENAFGLIRHQFILRPIDLEGVDLVGLGLDGYYDLTTPYGYGGPVIMEVEAGREDDLISAFHHEFALYCQANRIVSEFIRFHPLGDDAQAFRSLYQVDFYNRTLGINLVDYDDPFQAEFSKSARKCVRQCLRQGLTYQILENPDSLSDFSAIYYQTMDRNQASEDYYFDEAYFDAFIATMSEHVIKCSVFYQGETIAMGFYLRSDDILHTHLSGTASDYLHLSPAYVLRYAALEWAKAQGLKLIHSGGGMSGDPQDSLYRFKKRFSKHTEFEFFLGQKIWDQAVYSKLVEVTGKQASDFFPAYRAKD